MRKWNDLPKEMQVEQVKKYYFQSNMMKLRMYMPKALI